jgi:hypothetical protein
MTLFDSLRNSLPGPVLTPTDAGFAEEVSGSNLAISHRPDVVVGVTNAGDVIAAVRFAAAHRMPVRVQATGHGAHHPITDGMLLTTRRLDEVTVDAGSRLASIGPGATWRRVQSVVTPLGLTGVPGSSMTVGAVGYTLGGGLGPLSRSHGFTSDYVRGFEVVTAAGELVIANQDENAELFWALRGGKVGLGVVTRMQLALVPLQTIYAGALFFGENEIEPALRGWIDWTSTAPDDVTTSAMIMNLPDFDAVPPPLRGRRVLSLRFAYPGDENEGQRLAEPLRNLGPAIIDSIATLPTAELGMIHNDPDQPGPGWSRGVLLTALDNEFATELLARIGPGTTGPLLGTEIRHLGAATTVDVPGGSAVGGRASAFTFTMIGVPNPELFDVVIPTFADELLDSIRPWISDETTINFAGDASTMDEFAAAWPREIHDRLQAARALYDPQGLFTYGPSSA